MIGALKSLYFLTWSSVDSSARSSFSLISSSGTFPTMSLTQEPDGTLLPDDVAASRASPFIPDSAYPFEIESSISEWWRSISSYRELFPLETGIDTRVDMIWVAFSKASLDAPYSCAILTDEFSWNMSGRPAHGLSDDQNQTRWATCSRFTFPS